jgi:hypothetical protein
LPLAKSRDKEKKGNKLPFGGRKVALFLPLVYFFQRKKIKEKVPFGV